MIHSHDIDFIKSEFRFCPAYIPDNKFLETAVLAMIVKAAEACLLVVGKITMEHSLRLYTINIAFPNRPVFLSPTIKFGNKIGFRN